MSTLKKKLITKTSILILFISIILISLSTVNAVETNITSSDDLGQTITNASDGDTINLDPGTYTNNITNITINKNLTLKGNGTSNNVIIDAQNIGRIFNIIPGNTLTLINLTLTNGYINDNGGAIYNNGKLTISNCTFINNNANIGGAIYNTQSSLLQVDNSNFINNNAISSGYGGGAIFNSGNNMIVNNSNFINNTGNNSGGAIYNNGGLNVGVNMSIINSSFIGNKANTVSGGAIYNAGVNITVISSRFINNTAFINGGAIQNRNVNMTINDSNFTNNTAGNDGGAIEHSNTDPTNIILTITNSKFENNTAGSSGGSIYNYGSAMQLNNSDFIDNTANAPSSYGGGAIFTTGDNNITINNSRFSNNTATSYGGSIYIYFGNNIIIANSNFTNNTAGRNGGAIYNLAGNNITINNSKFNKNIASSNGGSIYNNANMSVNNSNFTNNSAMIGGVIFNNGSMLVSGNIMEGNVASVLGQEIYNNGTMGILNLTYLNNSTITVNNNSSVILYATLTDDMGNTVTGQNISFYVNGTFVGNASSIEGLANITYLVTQGTGILPVNGTYAGNGSYDIIIKPGALLVFSNTTVTSEITLNKDEYKINETVHGKITITNTGNNTATNVTTKVNFPSGFVLNSSSVVVSKGTFDPITNIWTIGDLAPDEEATMTFTGRFTTAGEQTISIETTGNNFATSTDSVTVLVETTPTPPEPPEPTPTPTNETTNVSVAASASMKETGISIITILLVLLTSLGLAYRKK